MRQWKGPLAILGCYVCWGILPVFWKQLGDVSPVYVLAARIIWSLILAAVILSIRRDWGGVRAALRDRAERRRLAAAGVCVTLNWGLYIWAVNAGHLLDASLAYYMNPILAILLGTLVYREKLTRLQWISVAVTLAGLLVTMVRYRQIPWIALLIGGSFALYGAVKKKVRADAAVSMFLETLLPAPVALCVITVMELQGTGAGGVLSGGRWLLLPAAGVVTTIPLMLYAAGIRTTSLSLSGILMYVNPTLQLLLSTVVYHEAFTLTHAILFGFVWTGLLLYLLPELLRHGREKKEGAPCA